MAQVSIYKPEDFDTHIPQILADMQDKNLLLLQGPLGAGKTAFVKRLGKHLGVERHIVSPTFAYTREYILPDQGRMMHLDLYRYRGSLEEILPKDIQGEARIICIEWPEMVKEVFDFPHLIINLQYGTEKDSRTLLW
ncbi:MAG: tRNA (adenosine(37)-N6)-threonylcarbamoyltransferase complex ATPase subunit type 1 TsaE [Candidatus Abawacabacteria bacterium RBG_16_42_10]|uniref:tRNA threonylcarbamoyladenosine biosynthesis protein TsaE n=1 Tax=Candidatus Abawacabacteria bacterium RBG_16_42_10 TaxID=1817814 RepID=A0A1F4XLX5_9BACT|nr:MAG: tRNA (adenosine(37)-N6)-threonylcarbamoyltransferase complex ATPase subunit type 1 TsaE [Candidatus Abawacabacteria bacterium RBG_16_42_10]